MIVDHRFRSVAVTPRHVSWSWSADTATMRTFSRGVANVRFLEEVGRGRTAVAATRRAPGSRLRSKRISVAALLLVIPALGAGATAPSTLTQVTHGLFLDPSISPDGHRMVLLSIVGGKEQIFRAKIDGGNPVQITHDPFDHEDPAWSPVGDKIAYVSMAGGMRVIHIMSLDGSGDEALTPLTQKTIHPNWSADGRSIIYCTDDDLAPPAKNTSTIYAIDLETHLIRPLISGGVNTYGVWSPDKRHIAFRKIIGEINTPHMNSEIFLSDGNGKHPKNLTHNPAFDGWPAWSPDGKQIAFGSNRGSDEKTFRIWVMNADGSNARLVADTTGRATAPQWAKDGSRIYFPICKRNASGPDCNIFAARAPSQ
jgi:TolB protein